MYNRAIYWKAAAVNLSTSFTCPQPPQINPTFTPGSYLLFFLVQQGTGEHLILVANGHTNLEQETIPVFKLGLQRNKVACLLQTVVCSSRDPHSVLLEKRKSKQKKRAVLQDSSFVSTAEQQSLSCFYRARRLFYDGLIHQC